MHPSFLGHPVYYQATIGKERSPEPMENKKIFTPEPFIIWISQNNHCHIAEKHHNYDQIESLLY